MRRYSVEQADRYLAHYSDSTWCATGADKGRVRIIGPSEDYELDENDVTDVKLTAYLYSWRVQNRIRVAASGLCPTTQN
jgi:hypothetical protein